MKSAAKVLCTSIKLATDGVCDSCSHRLPFGLVCKLISLFAAHIMRLLKMPIQTSLETRLGGSEERLLLLQGVTGPQRTRKVHEVLKVFGHDIHAKTAVDSGLDTRVVFVDTHVASDIEHDLATSSLSIIVMYHDLCLRDSRDLWMSICPETAARLLQMLDQAMQTLKGSVTS